MKKANIFIRNLKLFTCLIFISIFISDQLFAQVSLKAKQIELHSISKEACTDYNQAKNDIQKSEVYNQINNQKQKFGQELNWQFSGWKGNVMKISTNQGGDYADVEIVSEYNGIIISYEDISLLGIGGVSNDEAVYTQLRELQEGDPVIFSGKFEQGDRGIAELSLTERGSICAPELNINLTGIELNPEGSRRKSNAEQFAEGVEEGVSQIGTVAAWVFAIFFLFFILIKVLQGIGKKTAKDNK